MSRYEKKIIQAFFISFTISFFHFSVFQFFNFINNSSNFIFTLNKKSSVFTWKTKDFYYVAREGLEPPTHGLWFRCSNQLSYLATLIILSNEIQDCKNTIIPFREKHFLFETFYFITKLSSLFIIFILDCLLQFSFEALFFAQRSWRTFLLSSIFEEEIDFFFFSIFYV